MAGMRSLAAALLLAFAAADVGAVDPNPNVIVVLVDDMGWKDLSCQGSDFYETPQIDRLAASGMRFTTAYSACTVCSPTRAAIMTSQYPARLHLTDWITGHHRPHAKLQPPDWTKHLPLEVVTVAERLKAKGYAAKRPGIPAKLATYAAMGKILDLTGAGIEPGQPIDGRSLSPLLRGDTLAREALYWHYPHYHPGGATPHSAIRAGNWRLVHFYEDDRDELYDLAADPGETTDVAKERPEKTADLRRRLDTWLADVGGQLPTPNPDVDPARDRP